MRDRHAITILVDTALVVAGILAGLLSAHASREAPDARRLTPDPYATALAAYLAEARGLAELLAECPEPRPYQQRIDQVLESYRRLPASAEQDPHGSIDAMLREINLQFAAAQVFVARRDAASCRVRAAEQVRRIERVEKIAPRAIRAASYRPRRPGRGRSGGSKSCAAA